jgi:hypothetical protein
MYEDIKENLITMFNEHKNKENHEFDNEFLIKHFNVIALNANTLMEDIDILTDNNVDSLNFIEDLFNNHVYCLLLETIKENNNEKELLIHSAMVYVEYVKYQQYMLIKNRMDKIVDKYKINDSDYNRSLSDTFADKIKEIKDRIKMIYDDLIINYPTWKINKENCDDLIQELLF